MSDNNRRIAQNTALLYVRMVLTMGVSLYTSRIVLNVLGVQDFGIYNIVGGIVILFSFLNTAMSSATQRFLSFELGRESVSEVKRIFSMSMTAHICIALLVIILAETVGLWFLNTKLNIAQERMNAANWVYQFSVFTFCLQIIRVPYNATIIAYEKMSFYAYISILEAVLKLLIVFFLLYSDWDKLKLYAALTSGVAVVILVFYKSYCNKFFEISNYKFFLDASLFHKLISFSGWSLLGGIANVGSLQGVNILLNIFWGVSVNAAMGIADQVSGAVYGLVSSFQTAFTPQIVKSYAAENRPYFIRLIFQTSKFSYYLMLLLALPILINTDFILAIWLINVPEYATAFCRLAILCMLMDATAAPLWMAVQATGKIRNYQLLVSTLILLNLPLAYILLKLGFSPEKVLLGRVMVNLLIFVARIIYITSRIKLPAILYIKDVILVILVVTLMAAPLPLTVNLYMSSYSGLIITSIMSVLSTGICIYVFGLTKNEREFIKRLLFDRFKRFMVI